MTKPKIEKITFDKKGFPKQNLSEKINEIIALINNHDVEFTKLNLQFAQIRLDLKSAMILHDEAYVPPGVDELSPGSQLSPRKDSVKVKKFKKEDPF